MSDMLTKIEFTLLGTRKTLYSVCSDAGVDVPDADLLCIDQCSHCNVWHFQYKLEEDLDGNPICRYCETLVGR